MSHFKILLKYSIISPWELQSNEKTIQYRDWDKLYFQYKQTNLSIAAFVEKRNIPLSVAYKQFHKRAIQNKNEVMT